MTQRIAATLSSSDLEITPETPEVRLFAEEEASIEDDAPANVPTSPEEIRVCAYHKWEDAGRPCSDGIKFWLEAEGELG